jgi:hypothetical protein
MMLGLKPYLFFLIVAFWGVAIHSHAQVSVRSSDTASAKKSEAVQQRTQFVRPKKPKVLSKEFSAGFRINTNGWSIFTDYGKSNIVDSKRPERFFNLRYLMVELSEKKSPRELRSSSGNASSSGGSNSYIFGKINNFYALKLGYGFRKMIAGKPDDQGAVSIHWINAGGISIGLLKPYYLNIEGDPAAIKYSDDKAQFLDPSVIMNSAGFSKGVSEIQVIPGAHFKTGFHFDFSGNLKNVIAIEVGFNGEYYSQSIPIMAIAPASPYFVDAYLSFQFGKRW